MARFTTPLLFTALLMGATPVLAGTVTVGPLGSGAAFTEIAPALAAAMPGDKILIEPGQYQAVGTLVVDKPLTILGAGSATTRFDALAGNPFDQPLPLSITGLGAGEEVRIVGLTLGSKVFGGNGSATLVVSDCVGPVVIADVVNGGPAITASALALVQVRNSDQVLFDHCSFLASATGNGSTAPTTGMRIEDSRVYVNNSMVRGASAATMFQPGVASDGAPGIHAINSAVRVSRSSVLGGAGTFNSLFFTPTNLTEGAAAVFVENSQVYARGGVGNLLQGGRGGVAIINGVTQSGAGGPAVELTATAFLSTVGDTVAKAGINFDGTLTTSVVVGDGVWLPFPDRYATLASASTLVAPGSIATFEIGGSNGGSAFTYYSLNQTPAFALPGAYGEVLLTVTGLQPLQPKILDGIGQASIDVAVPAQAGLIGVSVLAQTLTASTNGELSFSAPTLVAIR